MLIFAFPGTGKTILAKTYSQVIDLEVSDIKYDNRGLNHLTKEARKGLKRPLKLRNYRQIYREEALRLHHQGRLVLVAQTFLPSLLFQLLLAGDWDFKLVVPEFGLRSAYLERYRSRGNRPAFIRQVYWVWWPVLVVLRGLCWFFPNQALVLSAGQHLTQVYEAGFLSSSLFSQ